MIGQTAAGAQLIVSEEHLYHSIHSAAAFLQADILFLIRLFFTSLGPNVLICELKKKAEMNSLWYFCYCGRIFPVI